MLKTGFYAARARLSVTRVAFNSPGLVAYYSVVRVGSRNEVEPGHTGFAHFFEHVMFKGTKSWPEGTRDGLLGKPGFAENAFTSDDVTVYHLDGPSSALPKLIELEADRFRNLEYNESTFQTEAKAVLGGYHKNACPAYLHQPRAPISHFDRPQRRDADEQHGEGLAATPFARAGVRRSHGTSNRPTSCDRPS